MDTLIFFKDWFKYKKSAWNLRNQHPLSPYLLDSMLHVANFERKYGKGW